MAVAGVHNVSSFSPSFFGDSQVSGPTTRASSLLQMWRDLEGDHEVTSSPSSMRQRNGSSPNGSSTPISKNALENDNQGATHSRNEQDDDNSNISEHSTELGENERERVRHIFEEWMNSGAASHSQLNECERVSIIRKWVQTNPQQRDKGEEDGESNSHVETVCDELAIIHPKISGRRTVRRICGRQTLVDLLTRAQSERKKEIQGLSEQKPVSGFVHRSRIQALLRGRFLRTEISIPEKRLSSLAATELGLLRQRHTVSGLREGFLSKLDDSTPSTSASVKNAEFDTQSGNGNNSELETRDRERAMTDILTVPDSETAANETSIQQEFVSQVPQLDTPLTQNNTNIQEVPFEADRSQQEASHDRVGFLIADEPILNSESTEQESIANEMPLEYEDINHEGPFEVSDEQSESRTESFGQETALFYTTGFHRNNIEQLDSQNAISSQWSDNSSAGQDHIQESHEEGVLQEAIDSWLDMPSGDVGAFGRVQLFYFPDDDNSQSMEIRELFSRGHVSSLLRSGFRESLNQVLQSHVERLVNTSGDWESDNASFYPNLTEQEAGLQSDNRALSQSEAADMDFVAQSEDVSHSDSSQLLGTEWEIVNGLRLDMARLQQKLNDMQNMLEQCMDLQIDLQRSVRQEVSAALNRPFSTQGNMLLHDESQWEFVRKGVCCVCHDCKIDSLLYRCGHMCTCSKCAERLVEGLGKCPMCQAPVIEAVRAYFIQ